MLRSIVERLLRDPDPAGAAGGAGNGSAIADVPRGPVGKSLLEDVLAGMPPINEKGEQERTKTAAAAAPDLSKLPKEVYEDGKEIPLGSEDSSYNADGSVKEGIELNPDGTRKGAEHEDGGSRMEDGGGDPDKTPVGVDKRITKLLDRLERKEADEARLREEVAELRQKLEGNGGHRPPLQGQEANPFSEMVTDATSLAKAKAEMYDIQEWCEDHPEGGQRNGKEFTPEEVKELRRQSRRALDLHLPAREKQLQSQAAVQEGRTKMRNFLKERVPEFFDRESDEGRLAAQFAGSPEVAGRADADVIAAALAIGMPALKKRIADAEAKRNGGGNGNGDRPRTVVVKRGNLPPKPGANGTRGNGASAFKQAAGRFVKSQSKEDFADVLAALGAPGGSPTKRG